MNASDPDGIKRSGAARVAGRGYVDDPHLVEIRPEGWAEEVGAADQARWAWWAGWLEEDRDRDAVVAPLLQLRYW